MAKKILVIDDEELMQLMLIELFNSNGFDAAGASNGIDGMEMLYKEKYDLVLTDLVMPEKEGVETIKDIKATFPGIKIIAMSGGGRLNGVDYLELASALGADRAFHKPFDRKELITEVKALLQM